MSGPTTFPARVPVAVVRPHILSLRQRGMPVRDIAAAVPVYPTTIWQICSKPDDGWMFEATARAVLAVQLRLPPPRQVPTVALRRRVQALACRGWSSRDLGVQLGVCSKRAAHWARREMIATRIDERLAALYEGLVDEKGPSRALATYAHNRGWAPPEAWSDTTIADPDAQPWQWCREDVDEVLVRKAFAEGMEARRLNRAEQRAVALMVHRAGGRPGMLSRLLHRSWWYADILTKEALGEVAGGTAALA